MVVVQTGKDFYLFFLGGSQLEFEKGERKSRFTLLQRDVEEIVVWLQRCEDKTVLDCFHLRNAGKGNLLT